MNKSILAVALATCLITPVMAEQLNNEYYIGVGVGNSDFADSEFESFMMESGFNIEWGSTNKLMWGMNFNKHIGLEQSYGRLLDMTFTGHGESFDLEVTGLVTEMVFKAPINSIFTPYAKLGIASTKITVDGFSDSENGNVYALGLAINIPRMTIRLEHQVIDVDGVDLELTTVSASVNF